MASRTYLSIWGYPEAATTGIFPKKSKSDKDEDLEEKFAAYIGFAIRVPNTGDFRRSCCD
jgi:hypothetical protein